MQPARLAEAREVILARDGFEALRIYQQISKQIGLVILDFFLPVMDGDAVFDELCALNPDVAVVLSSGFAEQSKLGNMLALGLRGFIPKPYTREKLLEIEVRLAELTERMATERATLVAAIDKERGASGLSSTTATATLATATAGARSSFSAAVSLVPNS